MREGACANQVQQNPAETEAQQSADQKQRAPRPLPLLNRTQKCPPHNFAVQILYQALDVTKPFPNTLSRKIIHPWFARTLCRSCSSVCRGPSNGAGSLGVRLRVHSRACLREHSVLFDSWWVRVGPLVGRLTRSLKIQLRRWIPWVSVCPLEMS